MEPRFRLDDKESIAAVVRRGDRLTVAIDGREVELDFAVSAPGVAQMTIGGRSRCLFYAQDDDRLFLHLDGRTHLIEVIDEFVASAGEGGSAEDEVRAPMPGVVLNVAVAVGDEVAAGAVLLLIESMKLQSEVIAPRAGVVADICVETGQSFQKGTLLVRFEPGDEDRK